MQQHIAAHKPSLFFNTHFVDCLFRENDADLNVRGVYNYEAVLGWHHNHEDITTFMDAKYIVFPINRSNTHWTTVIASMEEKTITHYDSMEQEWNELYERKTSKWLEGLLTYIADDITMLALTSGIPDEELLFDKSEWSLILHPSHHVPQQMNGYDCGVYTCMFAEFITNNLPLSFTQDHIDMCCNRIALAVFSADIEL